MLWELWETLISWLSNTLESLSMLRPDERELNIIDSMGFSLITESFNSMIGLMG